MKQGVGKKNFHVKSLSTLSVRQRGAALIAAIFVIVALSGLGGVMTQRLILSTTETINEWYSSQSLAAAESGVQWAVWDLANGGDGIISNGVVVNNQSWMTTSVETETINGTFNIYTITSQGKAGGTAISPRTQRQISIQFMP